MELLQEEGVHPAVDIVIRCRCAGLSGRLEEVALLEIIHECLRPGEAGL
jgi:hypothetical protein